jgi:hypothetical protein
MRNRSSMLSALAMLASLTSVTLVTSVQAAQTSDFGFYFPTSACDLIGTGSRINFYMDMTSYEDPAVKAKPGILLQQMLRAKAGEMAPVETVQEALDERGIYSGSKLTLDSQKKPKLATITATIYAGYGPATMTIQLKNESATQKIKIKAIATLDTGEQVEESFDAVCALNLP